MLQWLNTSWLTAIKYGQHHGTINPTLDKNLETLLFKTYLICFIRDVYTLDLDGNLCFECVNLLLLIVH